MAMALRIREMGLGDGMKRWERTYVDDVYYGLALRCALGGDAVGVDSASLAPGEEVQTSTREQDGLGNDCRGGKNGRRG